MTKQREKLKIFEKHTPEEMIAITKKGRDMKKIILLVLMFSMFAVTVNSSGAEKANAQTLSGLYVSQEGFNGVLYGAGEAEIKYLEFNNEFCRSSIAAGKYTIQGNTLYIEMSVFIQTYGGYASFEIVDPDKDYGIWISH